MPQLFVVNPSARRSKAGPKRRKPAMRRRRRTATRRRATRQVAVFRANPVRRRRRRSTVARRRRTYATNPIRRTVRRRRTAVRRFRRNPSARRMGSGAINFGRMILPAAGIGLGAVGTEVIMGYLPIPAAWKTGVMRHVTKGAVGVAAGLFLGKVLRQRRLGNFFALGAVAIAVHDAAKEALAARLPSVHMGSYMPDFRGSIDSGLSGVNRKGIGYYTPAVVGSLGGASTQHGDGASSNFAA